MSLNSFMHIHKKAHKLANAAKKAMIKLSLSYKKSWTYVRGNATLELTRNVIQTRIAVFAIIVILISLVQNLEHFISPHFPNHSRSLFTCKMHSVSQREILYQLHQPFNN